MLDKNAIELCLTKIEETLVHQWIGEVKPDSVKHEDRSAFQRLALHCTAEIISADSFANQIFAKSTGKTEQPLPQKLALLGDAAELGQHIRVATLLETIDKSNIDEVDADSRTALQRAAAAGHVRVLVTLVAHGANINFFIPGKSGSALYLAVLGRHLESVKFLLQSRADPELTWEHDGASAVRRAAESQSPQILQLVREYIPTLGLCKPDKSGNMPVHYAASFGGLRVCEYLVGIIPDFDHTTSKTQDGTSCLHLAAMSGVVEKIRFFLDGGSSISERSSRGVTPLGYAAGSRRRSARDACDFLISRGASVNETSTSQLTPLMASLDNPPTAISLAVALRLLEEQPMIDSQDESGNTALHYLIYNTPLSYSRHGELLFGLLADNGASAFIKNKDGNSPWTLLLRKLASIPPEADVIPDEPPVNDLNGLCTGISQAWMLERIMDRADFDESLLAKKDANEFTVLSVAVTRLSIPLIQKILKLNPGLVDLKDDTGDKVTPIEWACKLWVPTHLFHELVSHSKKVREKDEEACRAIIIAAAYGQTAALEVLLDHGMDIDYAEAQGRTAPMMAFKVSYKIHVVAVVITSSRAH